MWSHPSKIQTQIKNLGRIVEPLSRDLGDLLGLLPVVRSLKETLTPLSTFYIIFSLFSLVVGVFIASPLVVSLGAAVLTYMVVSWFQFSHQTSGITNLKIVRESEKKRVVVGKPFKIKLRLENTSNKRLPGLVVRDVVPLELRGDLRLVLPRVKPFLRCGVTKSFFPVSPGLKRWDKIEVDMEDGKGFYRRRFTYSCPHEVRVFPSYDPVEVGSEGFSLLTYHQRIAGNPEFLAPMAEGMRSPLRGVDIDFTGIRQYTPSDEYRRIDWKATARLGKLMTKDYESEVKIPIIVLLDTYPSMTWGPTGKTKLDYAINSTIVLARLSKISGDPFGLLVFSDKVKTFIFPDNSDETHRKVLDTLAMLEADRSTWDWQPVVSPLAGPAHPYETGAQLLEELEGKTNLWRVKQVLLPVLRMSIAHTKEIRRNTLLHHPLFEVSRKIVQKSRKSSLLLLISDLECFRGKEYLLEEVVRYLISYHHQIVVISPYTPLFSLGELDQGLRPVGSTYAETLTEHRKKILYSLGKHGVNVLNVGPDDILHVMLTQISRSKRGRLYAR